MNEATWEGQPLRFEFELSSTPTHALAAIIDQDRLLLANIPNRGWCCPSGKIEPGESPEQAAIREAYEETGATIEIVRRLGAFTLPNVAMPAFLARCLTLVDLPPSSESTDRKWIDRSELPTVYCDWNPLFQRFFDYAFERSHL